MYPCRSIDNTGINCRVGGGGDLSSWVTDADFKQAIISDFEGGCLKFPYSESEGGKS